MKKEKKYISEVEQLIDTFHKNVTLGNNGEENAIRRHRLWPSNSGGGGRAKKGQW